MIPSNVCDGPCGVYSYVWPSIVRELHFRHFSCGTNSTKVIIWSGKCFSIVVRVLCCPLRQNVCENNTILIPSMHFSNCQHTFKFFLGFLVWCHSLVLGFGFKTLVPGFIPHDTVRQEALTWSFVLVQKISGDYCPCLFVCLCQLSVALGGEGGGCKPWNSQALQ